MHSQAEKGLTTSHRKSTRFVMPSRTNQPEEACPGAADGFGRALQAADIGLWRWDLTTGAIGLSPRAAALLGCPPTQSPDYAGFIGLIDPDDRPAADKSLQDSVAARGHFDFDIRAAATGHWLRLRGQVFNDPDRPAEAAGILVNAVRRTSTEEMNSRLAAIVTSSDDAMIGEALDGTVTDWNHGAETMFGYTAAEVIGNSLDTLFPPGQEHHTHEGLAHEGLDRLKRGYRIKHHE